MCIVAMPNMALGFPVKLPCLTERERLEIRLFDKTTGNMNGECCGSGEEGQANDIPATLVVVYYIRPLKKMRPQVIISD